MDISFMTVLKLFYFICSSFLTFAAEDNLGLCSDPLCSAQIGTGLTTQVYNADSKAKLSFLPNQSVDIFVKDYGEKKNLIGVLLNGKKGFVPKTLVREVSIKIKDLVPATIKFGDVLHNSASQESQIPNQDVYSQVADDVINAQASLKDHQIHQEDSLKSSKNLVSNENLYDSTSSQAQLPSTEGYLDSQFASYEYQQTSPHFAQPPQQPLDTSIPTDIQQQFSNLETSYSFPSQSADINAYQYHSSANAIQYSGSDTGNTDQQNYGSDFGNTAQQNYGSDFSNTPQQNYVSDVSNTPQQQHDESPLPSQSNFDINIISSTENHMGHSTNLEQIMSSQFSSPEHSSDQFISTNSPVQQHFSAIQASFSAQGFDSPTLSPYPSSSFSSETNEASGEVNDHFSNYIQTDSIIQDVPSKVKQSTDSFISQKGNENVPNEHFFNPLNNQELSNEYNQYQDTMELLAKNGYDTMEYNHDYDTVTSSHDQNVDYSSDTFQQNEGKRNFEPKVDESPDTVHQMISQTNVIDSLSHTSSLEPSFQSSAPQLKADHSAEKTSNIVEQQKSDISEVSALDENHEDDGDDDKEDDDDGDDDMQDDVEIEIENESDNLYTEIAFNNDTNNQSNNTTESNQNPEKDIGLNEAHSHEITSHSENVVPSSDTQSSNAQKSKKQFNLYTKRDDMVSDKFASQNNLIRKEILSPSSEFDKSPKNDESIISSNVVELTTQQPTGVEFKNDVKVQTENEITTANAISIENDLNTKVANGSLTLQDKTLSNEQISPDIVEEKFVEAENLLFNDGSVKTDNFIEKEQGLDKILNNTESIKDEAMDNLNPYQIRNLKEDQESKSNENVESSDEMGDNVTYPEDDEYGTIENSLEAIRSFIEGFLSWIPEPFYSMIMDLENKGISPRVPVFTAVCAFPCILLIIGFVYIKESSKEKYLSVQLADVEKIVFTLSAEKTALEEKLEKTTAEFDSTKNTLDEERKSFELKEATVISLNQLVEKTNLELESNRDEINTLKEREKQYMELVKDHEKIHLDLMEEKSSIEKKVVDQEDYINKLSDQLEEKENEILSLQTEVEKLKHSKEDYEEKINQLQTNCNQLLKEAEVWNMRVNELNSKLSEESSAKEELQNSLELKDAEIKSLTNLVETLKSFEEIDSTNDDEHKSNEEKLKKLLDSSSILIKLQKQEEESKLLSDKLLAEKDKVLGMEVELLDSKSEIDKLKLNYNQALQDKAEATTKLEVLTNYFKDKELLLQKQLGAQEAFREKREKDADYAERQIVLIEQENASYKYQVASMKQEMEETERNLKTQIATQEKKAHENWIAARAAERKLEDLKQEVTQLRQRLTLLEREQENWVNSSRDDIIRPIPKRISGMNDESTNGQDLNSSIDPRHIFPPPPPMMLPPDRPLPPFLPPLDPPPFRPQPWHHMDPDFRMTPPDFMRGREVTPPRGRHSAIVDGDLGPLQSSPLGDMRESRNSTPPHSLPDFHDIPPPPPRPFFPPPPGHHPRYPMPPLYRREFVPGQKRTDNQSDTSSMGRGTQPTSSSQENWPHNSRV